MGFTLCDIQQGWNQTCGFLNREIAVDYGKLACAMGNWHCDVVYCQELSLRADLAGVGPVWEDVDQLNCLD